MYSKRIKLFASIILVVALLAFVYMTLMAIKVVNKRHLNTSDGIYISYVSHSKEIEQKAYHLTQDCKTKLCKIQNLLDYTSNIPYQTDRFQQNSPQKTIQKNFGDCDDKSNLLISMLYALEIEAYFVLVPKHIFVIVPLKDDKLFKKGLWINEKKYYILESTAKDSKVGFPLQYKLKDIHAIIEPFSNRKIEIKTLKYKL